MREVYLDYAATTPVKQRFWKKCCHISLKCMEIPPALYTKGFEAKEALMQARSRVASLIGAKEREIFSLPVVRRQITGRSSEPQNLENRREIISSLRKSSTMLSYTHANFWRKRVMR